MKLKTTILFAGCALVAAISSVAPARGDISTNYSTTILSQNPVGYWRLSETAPSQALITTAANSGSQGAADNGTYGGSQGFFRGYLGPVANGDTSVHFDGSSQNISVAYDAALQLNTFTIEGWFNADTTAAQCIASCGTFSSPRSGWLLYQTGSTGYELRGYWGSGTGVTFNPVGNVTTLPTPASTVVGNWTYVVATFDGTTAKIYLNGQLSATATPSHTYAPGVAASLFTIGERSDGGFLWAGKAGEVAYYNTALSASVIASHYSTASSNPSGYSALVSSSQPLLFFHLNEPGDPTTANLGTLGSAVQGAFTSGSTPGSAGPRPDTYPGFESTNYAVALNGTGSSVAVSALNLNTNAVTISGWIKASGSQNIAAGLVVADTSKTYAGLSIDGVNGGLGLGYVWNDNDANTYNWSPSADAGLPPLNDGEWDFVALVIQPNQANIYISSPTIPFSGVTNYLAHAAEKFEGLTLFGSDAGQATLSLNGSMDEVAIWNSSLSAGQLYSQYATAVGGLAPKILVDLPTPTLFAGDTLTLSADIGGTPPLSYQWYNSGGLITGATNSAYTKLNAQASDNSTYHVVVTNLYGTVTSASATVNVQPTFPPTIVTAPQGTTLYPGATLNLSVVADGGGLKYQWLKGGTPIPSATLSTYTSNNISSTVAGSYSVIVTNFSGAVTSTPAIVSVITPAVNSYAAAIVSDTPEAWYRLDETNGAILLHDAMGRHDGLYTNTTSGSLPTLGAAGAVTGSADTAASFDGTSVGVGWVPYSAALNAQQFAIEAWVKTSVDQLNMTAVSSRSASFKGYGIFQGRQGLWSGEVSQNGADYYVGSSTAAASVVPNQWTHIVMTYDTSLKVYINGQWDGLGYVDFQRNTDAPFIIGAKGPLPVADMFNGQLDEVAIYGHALTLAQAQNHYSLGRFVGPIPPFFTLVPQSNQVVSNSASSVTLNGQADGPLPISYQWYFNGVAITGASNNSLTISQTYSNAGSYVLRAINLNGFTNSPPATLAVIPPNPAYVNVTNGLVLHLKFDGDYQDSSGRGHNGTPTGYNGGTPSLVAGRLGSGAVHYLTDTTTGLPGNVGSPTVTDSSYVTLGNPADLLFSSNIDFSISYWVKLPAGAMLGDLPFLCSATNSTSNTGITCAPGYTNGGFGFSFNGLSLTGPANSINDGNWHHVLHSVARTGYAYMYVDGVQVDSQIAASIGNINTAGPINIGQDPTGIYPEQGSADVDDMAVWRRALTAYEAYSVYYAATNSNSSFDVPGTVGVGLKVGTSGTNIVLSWTPGADLGTLLQATNLTGPWTPVGTYAPVYQVSPTAGNKFFRLSFTQ